jgi:hypothetical protein
VIQLHQLIFWIPAFVSGILILVLWEELNRPLLYLAWFAGGLLMQAGAPAYSPVWVAAILLQAILAAYLGIRWKLKR